MRRISSAIAIFVLFLISAGHPAPVFADCPPATGPLQTCPSLTAKRCVVGSNAGVGKRTVLCCSSDIECINLQTQANQQNAGSTGTVPANKICQFIENATQQQKCNTCVGNGTGAWTALGCIQTDPQQFIGEILRIAIGIGGGVAFLLILFGGFQILTSAGNPEQLTAGREVVTSAITGLLLIIFSIFLLRLIGYNIFGIPGFG